MTRDGSTRGTSPGERRGASDIAGRTKELIIRSGFNVYPPGGGVLNAHDRSSNPLWWDDGRCNEEVVGSCSFSRRQRQRRRPEVVPAQQLIRTSSD